MFIAIGTAFGSGDGSTTFTLPDFRGKVSGDIGQGVDLTNRTLGQATGTEVHTLSINEIPSHDHRIYGDSGSGIGGSSTTDRVLKNGDGNVKNVYVSDTINTGGGASHNNMQPTLFGGSTFIFTGV